MNQQEINTLLQRPVPNETGKRCDMKDLGCSDGNCWFRHNAGQATNGGCNCIREQAINTGDGWVVPVQAAQIMVARAAQVAVDKVRKQESEARDE